MQKESFRLSQKVHYASVFDTILEAVASVAKHLRQTPVIVLQTVNKFGDQQLHQDVITDELVEKYLAGNPLVWGFASQQRPQLHKFQGRGDNGYIVTYDPLDGSSIIDTNFSVGSIFSIWPKTDKQLIGQKLSNQSNAILAVYGPRTTLIFWNPQVDKVQQITLVQDKWILSHEHLVIKPTTKMFSPGNLRATNQDENYQKIVIQWINKGYTLRYTGGLVPDITQIFIKGHGIFSNVASNSHKAKLRVLYEVAAVAFLIYKAEGKTIMAGKQSLLDYEIKSMDDRISFGAGSKDEVDKLGVLF